VVTRRASKKPVAEGGWNVFGTDFLGAEMLNLTDWEQETRRLGDALALMTLDISVMSGPK
jgi:hypothetical protein